MRRSVCRWFLPTATPLGKISSTMPRIACSDVASSALATVNTTSRPSASSSCAAVCALLPTVTS